MIRNIVERGKGQVNERLTALFVCEKMQWTYNEYLEAPEWLIDYLMKKWTFEGEEQSKQARKAKNRR